MSLYSVLMVDDEEEVIRIIRRKINWEEMGFQVCGQARNGLEALEMIDEFLPDVVMTDIKMPYMDGLQLTQKIKEKGLGIHTIIISGFDEFDYVKQAISLEVDEYLLKPIDSTEIIRVFEKVKNTLDEERDLKKNIAYLENYYQESLPLLRESFFVSLMDNSLSDERIEYYKDEYALNLHGPFYVIAIVHISHSMNPEGFSRRLIQMSVKQLLEKSLTQFEDQYLFSYRDNLVMVAQLNSADEISKFTDASDRFCKSAKRVCQAVVSVGVGQIVEQLKDISLSYKGAREAVSYRALYGAGNAINIAEIESEDNSFNVPENSQYHEIFKMIRMGSESDLEKAVRSFIESIMKSNISIQSYGVILMEIVTNIYRFLYTNNLDMDVISEDSEDLYSKLVHMDSVDEIQKWLLQTSLKLREQVQGRRKTKNGSLIASAQEYVNENYSDPDLSIDLICQKLGVSAAYFSTIFKKETGKTFLNYLTECRMNEAARLLLEEDEKQYIIAEKVGYSDAGYFSYVFKKWYGVSPMKYKKQGK